MPKYFKLCRLAVDELIWTSPELHLRTIGHGTNKVLSYFYSNSLRPSWLMVWSGWEKGIILRLSYY